MALALYCVTATAQTDPGVKNDSIRIGNIIIATKGEKKGDKNEPNKKEADIPMQADTTAPGKNEDTIRVGNIIILTGGEKNNDNKNAVERVFEKRNRDKPSNVSTNWFILDLGFSNYIDKTNYGNTGGYLYNRAGAAPLGESDFELNAGKSINVNIWLFMQRLNLIKHH